MTPNEEDVQAVERFRDQFREEHGRWPSLRKIARELAMHGPTVAAALAYLSGADDGLDVVEYMERNGVSS